MNSAEIPETCKKIHWACFETCGNNVIATKDGKTSFTFYGRACEVLAFVLPSNYNTVWLPSKVVPDI